MKVQAALHRSEIRTHLQTDIGPGQTAPSAEADPHVVQATVALGDVPDLRVRRHSATGSSGDEKVMFIGGNRTEEERETAINRRTYRRRITIKRITFDLMKDL